jgi:pimeloyl-ACP methyl ester carboxylesterase
MRLGRYDNPQKCVSYSSIADDVRQLPIAHEAEDGGMCSGILYTKGSNRTVVCFMHPQADMSRHYAIPDLLDAGYAALGQNSRYLNNDSHCLHETLLLDVAAGIRFLRQHGFEKIVLVGNSGGGSLYSFYLAQALTEPPERLTHTPAGDRCNLGDSNLPAADALVLFAAHLGEGRILAQMIDPSVNDEGDPLSCDPSLDPYRFQNGYRRPPDSSRFAADFIARYREAQQRRVARLDARARALLEQRNEARSAASGDDFGDRSADEQNAALRAAVAHQVLVVYRTEADLRALDTSLDPSERDVGTLFSYRPDLTNYMEFGFARVTDARAWLSTWSALSSNAAVERNAPKIHLPSLVLYYKGDNAIFPPDARAAFDALGSADKQIVGVSGDHYGFASGTQERSGARAALKELIAWLDDRFPH